MTDKSKIFDDITQLAGGAAGLLNGVGQQIRDDMKTRIEDMATDIDLVPRDEFERVEALLYKALADNEEIKQRLEKLESSK
jgi:BMFP domain-containing protein YqiC